jgi:uncharacterized protein YkwD
MKMRFARGILHGAALAAALWVPAIAGAQQLDARDILMELNKARAAPPQYGDALDQLLHNVFVGQVMRDESHPAGLITKEGKGALDDAVSWLHEVPPLGPLAYSPILSQSAAAHVAEQGPRGTVGHFSADGSGPGARAIRFGGGNFVAESISYGPKTPFNVLERLTIDDGIPGRGHRKMLFSPEYHFVGIACGPHAVYGTMCVFDFSATVDGK